MQYGNERSKMPSKLEIAKHWGFPTDDLTYCWGCGFPGGRIERAHLIAKSSGGDNNPDNFILLCNFCHTHIQEMHAQKPASESIRRLFKNTHLPFFKIVYNFHAMKINAGLYPNHIYKNTKGFKMPLMEVEHMCNLLNK